MGNCLVLQEKVVRVMKPDGKILEYKSPIKVHQVLSEFPHHAISDKLPVTKHMHPNADMHQGHLYYLLVLPVPPQQPIKKTKKKVRFSDDVKGGGGGDGLATSGVVRIKLVISKQELQAMLLSNEGLVSVDDIIISKMQKEANVNRDEGYDDKDAVMPTLECIPEAN